MPAPSRRAHAPRPPRIQRWRGARRWLVLAAGLLLTACQPADAAAPLAARPVRLGRRVRGPVAAAPSVLDVRPGDHRADDAAILAAATAAVTAVSRVVGLRAGTARRWSSPSRTPRPWPGWPVALPRPRTVWSRSRRVDRVYLDVPAWLALPPAGRQVLLTHEVTHLATGSAATDLPLWLEEGFADEVGPVRVGPDGPGRRGRAARPAAVRRTRSRRVLPTDSAFAAGGDPAAQAYAGAWLACRLLATDAGQRALVATYRAAVAGPGPRTSGSTAPCVTSPAWAPPGGPGAGARPCSASSRTAARPRASWHDRGPARRRHHRSHAGRDQRLPAAHRRHPDLRRRARAAPAAGLGRRLHLRAGRAPPSSTARCRSRWSGTARR